MSKKSSAPKAPNLRGLTRIAQQQAEMSYKLGQEQLAWAREQYKNDSAITGRVVDRFLSDMDDASANARADRERYVSIFQPLEDDLAREANEYDTPERRALEVGRSQAGVAQQFQQARQAAQSELESFGINPSATRYGALDIGVRAQEAAAKAAAGNQASVNVDNTRRALRSEAINVGRGYPGQVAQSYGVAQGAGGGAGGQQLATTQTGGQTMGTGTQWAGVGNNALSIWGNTLNQGYQNQLAAWQANQSQSSGIGGLLGTIAGAAFGFDEGGAVPEAIPVQDGAGAVPMALSPSGGRAIDDVSARLTPGEFVVPKEVVSWKGEEFFQKLIQKTKEAKQAPTNAKPAVRQAIAA